MQRIEVECLRERETDVGGNPASLRLLFETGNRASALAGPKWGRGWPCEVVSRTARCSPPEAPERALAHMSPGELPAGAWCPSQLRLAAAPTQASSTDIVCERRVLATL